MRKNALENGTSPEHAKGLNQGEIKYRLNFLNELVVFSSPGPRAVTGNGRARDRACAARAAGCHHWLSLTMTLMQLRIVLERCLKGVMTPIFFECDVVFTLDRSRSIH